MRILILGSTGQLGWEAQRTLATLGDVIALDYPDVDFTRPSHLARQVIDLRPNVIYNAVAYTAVDRAESEVEKARLINAVSAGELAEAAAHLGALLVHFSTDYVFDGKLGRPYIETDSPNPLNAYGITKLEGECAVQQVDCTHLILRTSCVYSMRRDSFVYKVLQWSKERSSLRIVSDQIGNPTWARMLAGISGQLLARGRNDLDWFRQNRGLYHLAGDGYASRLEWARAVLENNHQSGGASIEVLPALTSDFPTPAERPLFSALDCTRFQKAFGLKLPPWEKALSLAMQQ